ncbi:MAG: hypothetical protein CME61_06585 [Halobacteriovoraceae bacterium]|nr:hypothetical protein [Halobacteriovoraceae bacterium]|tara:strand:- start:595 stop:999 length:405 start_codon:yes stop_codon:yes gene_type:complete
MVKISLIFIIMLTFFLRNSGSTVSEVYECHENNRVVKLKKEVLDKILSKDIRGDWPDINYLSQIKSLTTCETNLVELLISSEEHFLKIDLKDNSCDLKKGEVFCEEILIDECCILKFRFDELNKIKKLIKKGRR